jgi:hypothetical protein
MLELLSKLWEFVFGLLGLGLDLLLQVLDSSWNLLNHLHNDAPLLEGLIIGVTLTWLLLRRDKHPLLRAVSAPLKLIVDILDLAWDQVVEVVRDVWGTAVSWVKKVIGWGRGIWSRGVGLLRGLRNLLSRKSD